MGVSSYVIMIDAGIAKEKDLNLAMSRMKEVKKHD